MNHQEHEGLVIVEMESAYYSHVWQLNVGHQSSGDGYLKWLGGDNFNSPGSGVLRYKINIKHPGVYRFQWRNIITNGYSSTDYNDSWLKILADKFYAVNDDGHIVCPIEQDKSNGCIGDIPNGSGSQGWFKVWRTGEPIDEWNWSTKTSDNDGHDVMAEFKTSGDYDILISGRSNFHAIDRFVLYRVGNGKNNVTESVVLDDVAKK